VVPPQLEALTALQGMGRKPHSLVDCKAGIAGTAVEVAELVAEPAVAEQVPVPAPEQASALPPTPSGTVFGTDSRQ
jgi:hypothetical protein